MRSVLSSICAALLCAFALVSSVHAFSYTKAFHGGTVRCTSESVRSVAPQQPRTFKTAKGEVGTVAVDVVDMAGKSHQYTFSVTTNDVASRKLGSTSRNPSLKAWDFVCRVQANQGVAHTCGTITGTSGTCLVCSDNSCRSIVFKVSRR